MILDTIYSILSGASGVTSITTALFAGVLPQRDNVPAVVFQRVEARFLKTFDGHNEFTQSVVQLDCYATTSLGADTLAAAVRAALIDYSAAPIHGTRLDNHIVLHEPDTKLHRVALRFTVWHIE